MWWLLVGCLQPPPDLLWVEISGCRTIDEGPRCRATNPARLVLWTEAEETPPVHVDDGPRDVEWTSVDGGRQTRLTLDRSARVRLGASWRLDVDVIDETPSDEAIAHLKKGERRAAWDVLRRAVTETSGIDRVEAMHNLAASGHPDWTWSKVEEEAVAAGSFRYAAHHALNAANVVLTRERRAAPALEAVRRARGHVAKVDAPVDGQLRFTLDYTEAQAHQLAGDHRRALAKLRVARETAARSGLATFGAYADLMAAESHLRSGDINAALRRYAHVASTESDRPCDRVHTANGWAWTMLWAREAGLTVDEEPAARLDEALDTLREANCEGVYDVDAIAGQLLVNRAWAALQAETPAAAAEWLEASRQRAPELAEPWAWELAGRIALADGAPKRGLVAFQTLEATRPDSLELRWMALRGQGRALAALGQRGPAIDHYRRAQALFREQAALVPVHLGRANYANARRAVADEAAALLLEMDRPAEAFDLLRAYRAQSLFGILQVSRLFDSPVAPPSGWHDAIDEGRRLQVALDELPAVDDVPLDERADLLARRAALHDEQLAALDRADRQLGLPPVPVPRRPDPGELFVGWYEIGGVWQLFAETTEGLLVMEAPGSTWPDDPRLQDRRAAADQITVTSGRFDEVGPAHLLPIPSGVLGAVKPVAFGLDLERRVHGVRARQAVIVADPTGDLPQTRREASAAAEVLRAAGYRVRRLEGASATRAAVREALEEASWFHYSGHGTEREAWGSALRLADGDFAVPDILLLGRGPSTVVLNGCATAGHRAPSTLGLGQAFVAAGAMWVVATDGAVDDRGAEVFAGTLYASWADTQDWPSAYRRAIAHHASLADPKQTAWQRFRLFRP